MALAGEEKSTSIVVPELCNHYLSQSQRFCQPAELARSLKQRDKSFDKESIIFKIRIELCHAVFPGSKEPFVSSQVREHKLCISSRGVRVIGSTQNHAGFSKAGHHQTIPGGDYFFIAVGFDALLTSLKQLALALRKRCTQFILRDA